MAIPGPPEPWVNSGDLLTRINIALALASHKLGTATDLDALMKIKGPDAASAAQKEAKLEAVFLDGELNPQARQTVLQQADASGCAGANRSPRIRATQARPKASRNHAHPGRIRTSDGSGNANTGPSRQTSRTSGRPAPRLPRLPKALKWHPPNPTRPDVVSSPPKRRHPERSAPQIYRITEGLWRGVEGPRRCLLAGALRSFPATDYQRN